MQIWLTNTKHHTYTNTNTNPPQGKFFFFLSHYTYHLYICWALEAIIYCGSRGCGWYDMLMLYTILFIYIYMWCNFSIEKTAIPILFVQFASDFVLNNTEKRFLPCQTHISLIHIYINSSWYTHFSDTIEVHVLCTVGVEFPLHILLSSIWKHIESHDWAELN